MVEHGDIAYPDGGEAPQGPRRHVFGKPRVFIGSSWEGRDVAACVQQEMADEVEATGWWQGVFGLSEATVESLEEEATTFDFAVLVATADDPGRKRGRRSFFARDNVVFEVGLFMGILGRRRTFVLLERDDALELPTDLAGMTVARFSRRDGENLRAAVGPACTELKAAIRKIWGVPSYAPEAPSAAEQGPAQVARRRRRRSLGTARVAGPPNLHHIVNISVTGALLETEREIPVGQLLELELELDNDTTARVTALVVRVQPPAWGLVPGVGVAFTRYDGTSRDVIGRYVDADTGAA